MLRVGLTGGIGSGKSTVAAVLVELGAVVIDADLVAREVVEPGTPTLAAIAARFGKHLVRTDGFLDRSGLAAVVFPDPAALADLDAITGQAITDRVAQLRSVVGPGVVTVFDMPLLVERRLWPREHLTLVVAAAESVRLERLVVQRGLAPEDARHRMAAQADDEQRWAAADVWVDNDGSREATEEQVRRLWAHRIVPFNDNLVTRSRSGAPETPALVEPDPTWPAQAARLVARVEDALGDRALSVEHIGSTSVSGLLARDVIDLQVTVRHLADADAPGFVAALEDRGLLRVADINEDQPYPARLSEEDWQERVHGSADPGRVADVHVREVGSSGWRFALLLRDWLRAEEAERQAYAREKLRLLTAVHSATEYSGAKGPWFASAYPRAVAWAERTGWRTGVGGRPGRGAAGSGALG